MILADVAVPYGDWIASAAGALQPVLTLALTGIASYVVSAYMPPWLKAITGKAGQDRVNQVLTNAVNSAIGRVQGAVKGQQATLPIASEILGKAVAYAVEQAPKLIQAATQGKLENLYNMVLARMTEAGVVPTDASGAEIKAGASEFHDAITAGMGGAITTAPKPASKPTLKLGDQGAAVKTLQTKLGITADGNFGPATEQAVKQYQLSHGLTADGVVGPSTWKALGG